MITQKPGPSVVFTMTTMLGRCGNYTSSFDLGWKATPTWPLTPIASEHSALSVLATASPSAASHTHSLVSTNGTNAMTVVDGHEIAIPSTPQVNGKHCSPINHSTGSFGYLCVNYDYPHSTTLTPIRCIGEILEWCHHFHNQAQPWLGQHHAQ